jgi:hypothetical protein
LHSIEVVTCTHLRTCSGSFRAHAWRPKRQSCALYAIFTPVSYFLMVVHVQSSVVQYMSRCGLDCHDLSPPRHAFALQNRTFTLSQSSVLGRIWCFNGSPYGFTGESIRGGLLDFFEPGLALLLQVHWSANARIFNRSCRHEKPTIAASLLPSGSLQ